MPAQNEQAPRTIITLSSKDHNVLAQRIERFSEGFSYRDQSVFDRHKGDLLRDSEFARHHPGDDFLLGFRGEVSEFIVPFQDVVVEFHAVLLPYSHKSSGCITD